MLLTRYAPFRRSPTGIATLAAPRLACVKPAASVHPEPGSNSSLYILYSLSLMPDAFSYKEINALVFLNFSVLACTYLYSLFNDLLSYPPVSEGIAKVHPFFDSANFFLLFYPYGTLCTGKRTKTAKRSIIDHEIADTAALPSTLRYFQLQLVMPGSEILPQHIHPWQVQ